MDVNDTAKMPEELDFFEHFNTDIIFRTLRRADYGLLCTIRSQAGARGRPGRAYLADLSRELAIPIPSLSRTVERLQDRGLVSWRTDRNAGQTYVKLTSKAVELMEDERRRMLTAYRCITSEIDRAELDRTMDTVRKITDILRETSES